VTQAWPSRQKAESVPSADCVSSMRPIVAASTGITKNDRLSMGAGARRLFERAKGRISIDGDRLRRIIQLYCGPRWAPDWLFKRA
jgi:uncharacterized protein (UPF0262 family)